MPGGKCVYMENMFILIIEGSVPIPAHVRIMDTACYASSRIKLLTPFGRSTPTSAHG